MQLQKMCLQVVLASTWHVILPFRHGERPRKVQHGRVIQSDKSVATVSTCGAFKGAFAPAKLNLSLILGILVSSGFRRR
jgi:hypothetical protein